MVGCEAELVVVGREVVVGVGTVAKRLRVRPPEGIVRSLMGLEWVTIRERVRRGKFLVLIQIRSRRSRSWCVVGSRCGGIIGERSRRGSAWSIVLLRY